MWATRVVWAPSVIGNFTSAESNRSIELVEKEVARIYVDYSTDVTEDSVVTTLPGIDIHIFKEKIRSSAGT